MPASAIVNPGEQQGESEWENSSGLISVYPGPNSTELSILSILAILAIPFTQAARLITFSRAASAFLQRQVAGAVTKIVLGNIQLVEHGDQKVGHVGALRSHDVTIAFKASARAACEYNR